MLAGTKAGTSHHRSPGGRREAWKEEWALDVLPWKGIERAIVRADQLLNPGKKRMKARGGGDGGGGWEEEEVWGGGGLEYTSRCVCGFECTRIYM